MKLLAILAFLLSPFLTWAYYIPEGLAEYNGYGRTPNGIVDLRTSLLIDSAITEEALAVARFFPDVKEQAFAVFNCESRLKQENNGKIVRGPDSYDVGIAQIRVTVWGRTAERLGQNLYTLAGNLGMARTIYDKVGWSAWKICSERVLG